MWFSNVSKVMPLWLCDVLCPFLIVSIVMLWFHSLGLAPFLTTLFINLCNSSQIFDPPYFISSLLILLGSKLFLLPWTPYILTLYLLLLSHQCLIRCLWHSLHHDLDVDCQRQNTFRRTGNQIFCIHIFRDTRKCKLT